jgi:hypothetical protein
VTGTLSDTVESGGSIRGLLDDAASRGFATSGDRFWRNETSASRSPTTARTPPGGVFCFGVIADLPFDAVSLRNESTTGPGDRIGFDDPIAATAAIPEPATAWLLLAGPSGLAAAGRRW